MTDGEWTWWDVASVDQLEIGVCEISKGVLYKVLTACWCGSCAGCARPPVTAVRERAAFTMDVPVAALATFDDLAKRRGLSRPKMFARLMAIEAQKQRLEEDLVKMAEDAQHPDQDPDEDAAGWSRWVSANPPAWLR